MLLRSRISAIRAANLSQAFERMPYFARYHAELQAVAGVRVRQGRRPRVDIVAAVRFFPDTADIRGKVGGRLWRLRER